jgi:hypothetical protein
MRLVLALAVVLLLPTTAHAAGPKITWPEQRSFAPGETISVKVASTARVRVALVRESGSGKVLRTVARRTLRHGTFTAAAPRAGRYSLRVGTRARAITVAAPSQPVSSGPLPPVEDPQLPACARPTGDRAELRLGAASVPAGGTLPLQVVNTSTGCLTLGVGYSFERLHDGVWVAVPSNQMFITLAVLLAPGETYAKPAVVPADAVPGTYRVLDSAYGAAPVPLVAQFEVTA